MDREVHYSPAGQEVLRIRYNLCGARSTTYLALRPSQLSLGRKSAIICMYLGRSYLPSLTSGRRPVSQIPITYP